MAKIQTFISTNEGKGIDFKDYTGVALQILDECVEWSFVTTRLH